MKYTILLRIAFVGIVLTAFAGCLRDDCKSTRTYVRFDPVYKAPSEFRVGISAEAPRTMHNPGKMYGFGTYLFINERQEGIHIIDNADPTHPQNIAFWKIPGNVDMAIKGNYLYVDQYVDLLTVDISDLLHPNLVCTQEEAFQLHGFTPQLGYLVDYVQSEITETISCDDPNAVNNWFFKGGGVMFDASLLSSSSTPRAPSFNSSSNGVPAATGIAGSYARFGIVDDFLYTVDNFSLCTWSLDNPSCPSRRETLQIGWNIETIFPWKDRLFVGSQTGVFIFNNSNPARPVQEAIFSHATGCDPVVCDENNAYVTIHDGTTCNGTFNQLDVIDIRNLPAAATLTKSYQMTRPMGLSVTNEHLFLCDNGLKIFDKADPADLKQIAHMTDIITYDVIAFSDDLVMVIGDSGFYQYDVSDPTQPRQISLIPVVK